MTDKLRTTLFISKATPEDDEFVLWLAPRLEAEGYKVFADILTLEPGDRWRRIVTNTLQQDAIKMLLCCRDATLRKDGVLEEIGIAEDVSKSIGDPKFIIPLRIERFNKVFGIGELHYIDFFARWAAGLGDLLDALERAKVPRHSQNGGINPSWEAYRKRLAAKVEPLPETLTSSWLQILSYPNVIRYYQPRGAVRLEALERACNNYSYPAEVHSLGFFTFGEEQEINDEFTDTGRFKLVDECNTSRFMQDGHTRLELPPRQAKNMLVSMFRQSWQRFCTERELLPYAYSSQIGFHVTGKQIAIGRRIPWGRAEDRRSAALRNLAGGKVWQYGVSAIPYLWPFPHFRIKSRVLFAESTADKSGMSGVIPDPNEQHRLRRRICKGWRNKQWHGRFMAFLELIGDGSGFLDLPLSSTMSVKLDAQPIQFICPVTTNRPDEMPEDGEEQDPTTLGIDFEDLEAGNEQAADQ